MKLCHKIAILRRGMGWSQEDLAALLDVSRQTVSRWESDRAMPDANRILRLSHLLGVSADRLLDDALGLDGLPTPVPPPEPDGPRRINAQDTYAYSARCQSEAWKCALAWATIPMAPSVTFLCLGLDGLLSADQSGAFAACGVFFGIIILLTALCELLIFLLGSDERKLAGGKPYILTPNALNWVADAYARYCLASDGQRVAAWILLLAALPAFVVFIAASTPANLDLMTGLSLSTPLALISGSVFLFVRTARIRKSYRYLIAQAEPAGTSQTDSTQSCA